MIENTQAGYSFVFLLRTVIKYPLKKVSSHIGAVIAIEKKIIKTSNRFVKLYYISHSISILLKVSR